MVGFELLGVIRQVGLSARIDNTSVAIGTCPMINEDAKAKSRRPPTVVVAFFAVSVLLFLASLTQDGFYIDRSDNPRAWAPCIGLLLVGWIVVFEGVFAWLANPALLVTWIAMWFRPTHKAAVGAGIAALCFALSFLLHDQIMTSE